ncbi:Serine/threonine-protein phosphatase 6 catalytic subunit [Microtus ochrogaster]|uniref:Serine/threonine-protein phosphatase 6 catalytic subunit n=1 Tax=Microtus ochrogaster TaxID=79684 RepID=A0A8J6GRP0_MICOH|nr:Serine/threonine-protein phosphatase 6 catalytic subunit [Microtus ochrogaster]
MPVMEEGAQTSHGSGDTASTSRHSRVNYPGEGQTWKRKHHFHNLAPYGMASPGQASSRRGLFRLRPPPLPPVLQLPPLPSPWLVLPKMAPLDLDKYVEIARQCKYLPENDLKRLCDYVCDLLLEESNVQPVSTPVTVCGDIHGQFVHINNLKLICRAHQLVHEGYKFMFDEKLVTVWSAPNYCYRCGNIASIMVFKDVNTREPKLFRAVPDSERVIPPRTTTPYFL